MSDVEVRLAALEAQPRIEVVEMWAQRNEPPPLARIYLAQGAWSDVAVLGHTKSGVYLGRLLVVVLPEAA